MVSIVIPVTELLCHHERVIVIAGRGKAGYEIMIPASASFCW